MGLVTTNKRPNGEYKMAKSENKPNKGVQTDLFINSIGVCVAQTTDKKNKPCVVVAYESAKKISFIFMAMPTKGLYTYTDFLKAIALAEGVKNTTYVGYDGNPKAIYCCRAATGQITDVIARDYEHNRFVGLFSEIIQSNLPFSIVKGEYAKKLGLKFEVEFSSQKESNYAENTYEYAIVNAYNACLLGRVFECEELQIETKSKKRAKIEVRNIVSKYIEQETLYIRPQFKETIAVIDAYETEEFTFIDGNNMFKVAYAIVYNRRLRNYLIIRK